MTSTRTRTIEHWADGKKFTGISDRTAPVTNPATGQVTGEVALASVEDARAVIDAAAAAFPAWRDTSLAKRTQVLFTFRELLNARKGELAAIITAEHGKVLSDALGEVSPRPGGRRVRLRHPAPAQGRLHRERLDQGRRLLDPPAARRRRHHLPVQLPGHGADVVLPDRDRRRQHRRAQAEREGPVGRAVDRRAVGRGRPARRRLQRAARRQGRRRRAADQPRGQVGVASSARPRSPSTSTRPAPRTASACRPSAAPRTTWWSCPTPTSTWPPTPTVNAGFGSRRRALHGDLRRAWPSARSPTSWSPRSPSAPRHEDRRRHQGLRHGPAGHQGAPRQGRLLHRRRRGRRRQDRRRRPRRRRPTAAADGFWLGPTLFDHVTPEMSVYTDEIFGPVLSVVRVESYDEALELINSNPYGNGTAIFTNDGGAARRFQNEVEVGMIGINVPIPVPMAYYSFGGWKSIAVRRHPRPRHRGRALLHPRQGRHHPLARPQPRRHQPRLPAEQLNARRTNMTTTEPPSPILPSGQDLDAAIAEGRRGPRAGPRPRLPLVVGAGEAQPDDGRSPRRAPTCGTATATSCSTSPRSWSTPTSAISTRKSLPPSPSRPPSCAPSRPQHVNAARSEAARLIAERTPGDLNKVFFTNGGADADEHAVRMARLHTGRYKVLSRYRSYHGGTDTAINLTGDPRRWPNDYGNSGVVHFYGPFLYRSSFHAETEAAGERARARLSRAADPARGPARRSRRSSSSRSPAPRASWCRRPATWPAFARSATGTASCSSPTR